MSKAHILVRMGFGLDLWADKLLKENRQHLKTIVIDDAFPNEHFSDPHVWMDPKNVIKIIMYLSDILTSEFPEHTGSILDSTTAYVTKLQELDSWIQNQTAQIPKNRRKLITYHDSFTHFAQAYNFQIIGVLIPNSNVEIIDPSALHIAQILKLIQQEHISSIFGDVQHGQKLAKMIAREAKIQTPYWLYCDNFDTHIHTYEALMRYDTETIVKALTQ